LAGSIFGECRNPLFLNAYKAKLAKRKRVGGLVWVGLGGFGWVFENAIGEEKNRPEDGSYGRRRIFQKCASTLFFIFLFPNNQKHFPAETPRFRDFGKSSLI